MEEVNYLSTKINNSRQKNNKRGYKMVNETNISKLISALHKAQASMSFAKTSSNNPFYNSKYANLSSVFMAVKDPFLENDLCVSQVMDVRDDGRMVLKTILLHSSGQSLESKMFLPDIKDPQKLGSAITYFRRYSLMSIAGIPTDDGAFDKDDDANEASRYIKNQSNKSKIEEIKPAIQKIGIERAVKISERLHMFPEYYQQIQNFLNKNKIEIEDLSEEFADRIEIKLNNLEIEHSESANALHA